MTVRAVAVTVPAIVEDVPPNTTFPYFRVPAPDIALALDEVTVEPMTNNVVPAPIERAVAVPALK